MYFSMTECVNEFMFLILRIMLHLTPFFMYVCIIFYNMFYFLFEIIFQIGRFWYEIFLSPVGWYQRNFVLTLLVMHWTGL